MRRIFLGLGAVCLLAGCGGAVPAATTVPKPPEQAVATSTVPAPTATIATDGPAARSDSWLGASAESEMILSSSGETFLGVWVDAPTAKPRVRAPVDIGLVIDTSGSMEGAKIAAARAAAKTIVQSLADGDIVSVDIFSNSALTLVAPTVLDARTRARVLSTISELGAMGGTNMFEGLTLAEAHVAQAPATHVVRRVVMISDGIANVGPSSPEALGLLAERGLRSGAQVTSLGVGSDYDEHTLNAITVKTNGHIFHLSDPREMVSIIQREVDLLGSAIGSGAFVEVVPAPGVELSAPEYWHCERIAGGSMRIPIGTITRGQHNEALLRVRLPMGSASTTTEPRAIASVRLHYRDPSDGQLERVQEIVAHVRETSDAAAVEQHANARTRTIKTVLAAAKVEVLAAQQLNSGQFAAADAQLAEAERALQAQESHAKDDEERARLAHTTASVRQQRAGVARAAAAPAPSRAAVQRNEALRMNEDGLKNMYK